MTLKINRDIFDNILFAQICLIPLALLTGPFLPDLLISFTAIAFIIIAVKYRLKKYFYNKFFYIFLFFFLYINLNSLFSIDHLLSFESTIFYFRFCFLALAVWYIIETKKKFIEYFFYSLLLCFTISIIDGYYQYFYDVNIFGITSPGNRLNLLLNDKRALGIFFSRLFPLFLALFIAVIYNKKSGKSKYFTILPLFIFVITDVLIYLTGERTAISLMFITAFILIIFSHNLKFLRFISIIISTLLIILITFLSPQVKERNISKTIEQIGGSGSNEIKYLSNEHHSLAITSINAFMENPIFGHGANTYRVTCLNKDFAFDQRSCSTHPHNTYLQIASELGVIGLFFLFYIIFIILIKLLPQFFLFKKNIKQFSDYQLCLICSYILPLIPVLPSLDFFNNWHNAIIYLPLGFLLQDIYKDKKI